MFYPAFLNLKNKKCVVIGGGKVAERKVKLLLVAKSEVFVVSPAITLPLRKLWERGKISYINSEYKRSFLNGAFLVIASTGNCVVNIRIYKDTLKKGILFNCVDSLSLSNFIVPSVIKRGNLKIAISTNGGAPCFAKSIRKELEKVIGQEYAQRLKIIEKLRKKIKNLYPSLKRAKILKRASCLTLTELKKDSLVAAIL